MARNRLDLVLDSLERGGAESVILHLATRFALAGCSVRVLTVRGGGALESISPSGVRLVSLGSNRARRAVVRLSRKLRDDPPSAILATQAHASAAAVIARLLSGISARLILRETTTPTPHGGLMRLVAPLGFCRMAYKFADGVVAPSVGVGARLRESIPAARVSVIPNPVDVDRIECASKEPLPPHLTLPAKFFVGLGNLRPVKRFDRLIEAYSLIAAQVSHDLVIVGDGPERHNLVAHAERLGVGRRVRLLGAMTNPFPVLARADVFVLSSEREGLPNALLEALALSMRVVAVDCPSGPMEILEGGRLGSLVQIGDISGLANAILASLERAPVSTGSLVRSRYGPGQISARYLEVLGIEPRQSAGDHTNVESRR